MSIIVTIDKVVNDALVAIRVPLVNKIFWLVSASAYVFVAGILAYFFIVKPARQSSSIKKFFGNLKVPFPWLLLAAYGALYLSLSVVKQYAARVRPNGTDWLSFPSRHAAFAFFIAFTFPTDDKRIKTALYTWAALVAFSRLVLAEHWLSDIVVGAGVGLAFGLGFKKLIKPKR